VTFRVLLLACAAALLQDPQGPATFRASVARVAVDVNVIGEDGRPISDLTVDDFVLTVDGQPRKILSAQFIPVQPQLEVRPPVTPAYSSNAHEAGGRLVMFVVDRGSIEPGIGKGTFESAARFVGSLNSSDRVGLISVPTGPQSDFTLDHTIVQSMLRTMDGTAIYTNPQHPVGISDALAIEHDRSQALDDVVTRECGSPGDRGGGQSEVMLCRRDVREEAGIVTAEAHERTRNTLIALQSVLKQLASNDTPKTIILISQALVIDRDSTRVAWFSAFAAAAHVTLYAIHLDPSEFDTVRNRLLPHPSADRAVRREGLEALAAYGRGDVFRVMSNADYAFQRLALELSGYYLLSFEPAPGERDGRAHKIHVEVRRGGVTLRARREFTAGLPASTNVQDLILETLRNPVLATEIPVRATTYSFQDPGSKKLRVLVAAEIDRSSDAADMLAVGYALLDPNGKGVTSQLEKTLKTPIRPETRTQGYYSAALVDPGPYTLKLAVVDQSGRRGSVERSFRAALRAFGQVHATDLLIADNATPSDGSGLTPAVTADFSGDMLHGYLELFSDAPEALRAVAVTFEVARNDSSMVLDSAAATVQDPDKTGRSRVAGGAVPIALLPPGDYVARAAITSDGRRIGQVVRPFRIVKKSAP
jgi:VWFA-related protein